MRPDTAEMLAHALANTPPDDPSAEAVIESMRASGLGAVKLTWLEKQIEVTKRDLVTATLTEAERNNFQGYLEALLDVRRYCFGE